MSKRRVKKDYLIDAQIVAEGMLRDVLTEFGYTIKPLGKNRIQAVKDDWCCDWRVWDVIRYCTTLQTLTTGRINSP